MLQRPAVGPVRCNIIGGAASLNSSMAVTVVPYSSDWGRKYQLEEARIRRALGSVAVAVHHIGSTAIPGILAKPVIDVLVEATSLEAVDIRRDRLDALGYEAMGAYGIPGRRYFRKDTANGVRAFHVHVFARGSVEAGRHLAFLDYLQSHPRAALEYSELKRVLTATHNADKNAYVAGKASFVARVMKEATAWKAYE